MHRVPFPILRRCSLITTPTTSKNMFLSNIPAKHLLFFSPCCIVRKYPTTGIQAWKPLNGKWSAQFTLGNCSCSWKPNRFCNQMPCRGTKKKSGTLSRLQHLPTQFTSLKNISANIPESPFRGGLKIFCTSFRSSPSETLLLQPHFSHGTMKEYLRINCCRSTIQGMHEDFFFSKQTKKKTAPQWEPVNPPKWRDSCANDIKMSTAPPAGRCDTCKATILLREQYPNQTDTSWPQARAMPGWGVRHDEGDPTSTN